MNTPHKKLKAWSDAVDLVQQIYKITERFPPIEQFGHTNQFRRAADSSPSNIAEGADRQTRKEFLNFQHIAKGSLSELDNRLEIAQRLECLGQARRETLDERLVRIDRMLSVLVRSPRNRNNP